MIDSIVSKFTEPREMIPMVTWRRRSANQRK